MNFFRKKKYFFDFFDFVFSGCGLKMGLCGVLFGEGRERKIKLFCFVGERKKFKKKRLP
jgi:hypothetical protein